MDFNYLEEIVGIAYDTEIRRIVDRIFSEISTIVEVEKEVVPYLVGSIKNNLKKRDVERKYNIKLIGGSLDTNDITYLSVLKDFENKIINSDGNDIYILPHLDLMTAADNGLTGTTKIFLQLLSSYPHITVIGFFDPNILHHKSIYEYFNSKIRLLGIKRDKIKKILNDSEIEFLKNLDFPPIKLFKYTSGMNPISFRKIISVILKDKNRLVYDDPEKIIVNKIKDFVSSQKFEMPNIDIDKDIGGYKDVKKILKRNILDIIKKIDEFSLSENLKAIKEFEKIIPKGVIFYGPPGTGKTLFAKAIATAINGSIYIISGPEIKSKWYGESEENIRKVFYLARKNAPSVIVFDELDSIASSRNTQNMSNSADHSIVNQLLTELDGFRSDELVIFVGTTNFIDSIDPAILRPGRVELKIGVGYPDNKARRTIIEIYNKKYNLNMSEKIISYLAEVTEDPIAPNQFFTGDHIHTVTRYLKRELIKGGNKITKRLIEEAIAMITQPVKLAIDEQDIIAVHEAGHALLSYLLIPYRKVKRVSIETKSSFLGGVVSTEEIEDKYSFSREEIMKQLIVILGGRAAEYVVLGNYYTGSTDDIQKATEIAEIFIKALGFSSIIGPVYLLEKNMPETLIDKAGEEIQKIITKAAKTAEEILEKHKEKLLILRDKLLLMKTIFLEDIEEVMKNVKRQN
jgi:cell division protease FtsH